MITLQGFAPAWTLPCLSPFVTKTAYYMRLAGIEYAFASVNPFELKTATPFGKVPVINDDGKVVADSTTIIDYLERTRGEPLNKGATLRERAVMLAFNRLLDEHFYWCAVVLPRWRNQENWENYIPVLCGGRQPDQALRQALEVVRAAMLAELEGHGIGRLDDATAYARARADVDALAAQLGDQPYFMGDRLRTIDASVLAFARHVLDSPFPSDVKQYMETKPSIVAYVRRLSPVLDHGKSI